MRLRSIRRRVGTGMVLLILLFGLIAIQAIVSITSFGRLVEDELTNLRETTRLSTGLMGMVMTELRAAERCVPK